jgi:hypothetical protein
MEDKFEKFITENREAFDIQDPDPKIWRKIKGNLQFSRRPEWKQILQKVAVIAVIFAASYLANEMVHRYQHGELKADHPATKSNSVPGLTEAEAYYTSLLNQKMDELKPVMANCPALAEELNYDMTELDSVYTDLKKDLKDNMANQEVVEAIIENYRLKIKILEELLSEIKPQEDDCLSKNDGYAL